MKSIVSLSPTLPLKGQDLSIEALLLCFPIHPSLSGVKESPFPFCVLSSLSVESHSTARYWSLLLSLPADLLCHFIKHPGEALTDFFLAFDSAQFS